LLQHIALQQQPKKKGEQSTEKTVWWIITCILIKNVDSKGEHININTKLTDGNKFKLQMSADGIGKCFQVI
jgi:hypothetical protein